MTTMATQVSKSYHELILHKTYYDRLMYCKLDSTIGDLTFGIDRYLNQKLYASSEWKNLRNYIIARDLGCDLGVQDCPVNGLILVHHLNPLTPHDLHMMSAKIFDPDNLICVSHDTHNMIHYGIKTELEKLDNIGRKANDTCPWK